MPFRVAIGSPVTLASSYAVTIPGSVQVGDLMIVAASNYGSGLTPSVSAGWTVIQQQANALLTAYRIATPADVGGSGTVTVSGMSGAAFSQVLFFAYSPSVLDVSPLPTGTSSTPSVTTTVPNETVVSVSFDLDTSASDPFVVPGGISSQYALQTGPVSGQYGYYVVADTVQASPGASPVQTFTQAGALSNQNSYTFTLRPVTGQVMVV